MRTCSHICTHMHTYSRTCWLSPALAHVYKYSCLRVSFHHQRPKSIHTHTVTHSGLADTITLTHPHSETISHDCVHSHSHTLSHTYLRRHEPSLTCTLSVHTHADAHPYAQHTPHSHSCWWTHMHACTHTHTLPHNRAHTHTSSGCQAKCPLPQVLCQLRGAAPPPIELLIS